MTIQARGRFITLEGGEGAGKSVQAKRLEERLAALGIAVVRTREPGGSPGAEALREAILSGFASRFSAAGQALLFSAARVDHLDQTILPALARGAWVVSDRFADFDPGLSRRGGESAAGVHRLSRVLDGRREPARPDLILDLDPEVGLKRAAERRQTGPADRFESEGLPFHQTLRRAFLDIAAAEPLRCVIIDAEEAKTTSPPRSGRRSKQARSGGRAQGEGLHELPPTPSSLRSRAAASKARSNLAATSRALEDASRRRAFARLLSMRSLTRPRSEVLRPQFLA